MQAVPANHGTLAERRNQARADERRTTLATTWLNSRRLAHRPAFIPFVDGLLAAVAFAVLTSTGGGDVTGASSVAIGMGIVAAVVSFTGWKSPVAWVVTMFYNVLAVIAFIPSATDFIRSDGCLTGPPPALRLAGVVLLVLIALVFFVFGLLFRPGQMVTSTVGLALFGSLQILMAAGMFIAGSGSSSENAILMAVLLLGAPFLGWLAAMPSTSDAVLGVSAAAFGMQSLYTASVPGCAGANMSGVVLIVVFCVAFAGTRLVGGLFRR